MFAAACAGSSRASSSDGGAVITRAELDVAGSVSAFDAVQRLRPNFLRGRGPTSIVNTSARTRPAVFVDGSEYGEIESLRTFPASRVEEIRFLSGPEAVTRLGSVYVSGVIQVRMRVQ
jgi:hypothetical protein